MVTTERQHSMSLDSKKYQLLLLKKTKGLQFLNGKKVMEIFHSHQILLTKHQNHIQILTSRPPSLALCA